MKRSPSCSPLDNKARCTSSAISDARDWRLAEAIRNIVQLYFWMSKQKFSAATERLPRVLWRFRLMERGQKIPLPFLSPQLLYNFNEQLTPSRCGTALRDLGLGHTKCCYGECRFSAAVRGVASDV